MPPNILIHLVPALRPQIDGAGDSALNLARALRERHGIPSRFIVCNPERNGPTRVEGFVVQRLRRRSEAGVWSLLASAREPRAEVLLHYCAHGYHSMGVPLWLYCGIKSWLGESRNAPGSDRRFDTIFYDSPTAVKPWRKEYWLKLTQQWLLLEIHRQSRCSVTRSRRMQALLDGAQPGKTLWLPALENAPANEAQDPAWQGIAGQLQEALFQEAAESGWGAKASPTATAGDAGLSPNPPAMVPSAGWRTYLSQAKARLIS